MKPSIEYLLNVMSDPDNQLLYIIDVSGSQTDKIIENHLKEVAFLREFFDPNNRRIIACTDEFMRRNPENHLCIPAGALNVFDIPGAGALGGGGGELLQGIEVVPFLKEWTPTHIIYGTDLMMDFPAKEKISYLKDKEMAFIWSDPYFGSLSSTMEEAASKLGAIYRSSSEQDFALIYAERDAASLQESTRAAAPARPRRSL